MNHELLTLAFMAALISPPNSDREKPAPADPVTPKKKKKRRSKMTNQPSSWDQIRSLLIRRQFECPKIHTPPAPRPNINISCSSICTSRDVVRGSTRILHPAEYNSPDAGSASGQEKRLLVKKARHASSSSSSLSSRSVGSAAGCGPYAGRGVQLRKLSGCYECHAVVDPSRNPMPRTSTRTCSECGEVFPKIESLEHHQAVRHAVSEVGPEDSSHNIVEIIFKSSWVRKGSPVCKIERILKVHNTHRTIQRFEDYRDAVKARAAGNAARCAADGNELLRFHCATLACSLGARGSSSLCGPAPACGVCNAISHGFQGGRAGGIRTTASSGRAHDSLGGTAVRRAMLVCRVIAGRVRRASEEGAVNELGKGGCTHGSAYDSVAGSAGIYSDMEEMLVFSSRAILPCFVVIYQTQVLDG